MSPVDKHEIYMAAGCPTNPEFTPYQIDRTADPLTPQQTKEAVNDLYNKNVLANYPKLQRHYADNTYKDQIYCLHSFVPSKTAVPDKDGVYGMIKFRGTFPTVDEADDRAANLIKNEDSFHTIYAGYVGKPFPLLVSSKYSKDIKEIDIRKKAVETISEDMKSKREQEVNKGLEEALNEFLVKHQEWKIKVHYAENGGLTVLRKYKEVEEL